MRALSFKQPWAELILQGRKNIDIRKWNTKFRGKFLIHASKIPDKKSMKKFGFENLPYGAIIGKAELTDVKKYKSKKEFMRDKDKHLATLEWGNYGFLLKNVKRMKEKPFNGKLGFWKFN